MPIPAPKKVSVSEARKGLASLLEEVAAGDGARVVVERYGKPLAVILHPDEVAEFEAVEDRYLELEVARMRAAGELDDGERLTTEQVLTAAAKATAAKTLAAALERASARGRPPAAATTPRAAAAVASAPAASQAPAIRARNAGGGALRTKAKTRRR